MKDLVYLPMFLMENRETKQWHSWLVNAFSDLGFNVIDILPQDRAIINTDSSMFMNKEEDKFRKEQLDYLFSNIPKNFNGIIFFGFVLYYSKEEVLKIRKYFNKAKLIGFAHGGYYDFSDRLSVKTDKVSIRDFEDEKFILSLFDKVIVGTKFHYDLIYNLYGLDNMVVIGYPVIELQQVDITDKEDLVVFPHRLHIEKAPIVYQRVKDYFAWKFPNIKFIETANLFLDKKSYYDILKKAKIVLSTAFQETFGIAMLEGWAFGAMPLAPRRVSYREVLKDFMLYTDYYELKDKILDVISRFDFYFDYLRYNYCYSSELKNLKMFLKNV